MKMRKYIIYIPILLAISFVLMACGSKDETIMGDANSPWKEGEAMFEEKYIGVEDFLSALEEMEQTEEGKRVSKETYLTVEKASISDLYDGLLKLYGGPIEQGMEPYVESNGGAVQWYIFDAGEILINIRQGSKRNYVIVEIKENPEPSKKETLCLRKMAEDDPATLSARLYLKVTDYEEGILTVLVSNQTDAKKVYSDGYILAKSSDNGQTYAHMMRMGLSLLNQNASTEHEIEALETQELKCDLRVFGQIEAGKYMIIMGDLKAEFQLISEKDSDGTSDVTPWFCPNCGRKNIGTDTCEECGSKNE